jgi:hypothetical protein
MHRALTHARRARFERLEARLLLTDDARLSAASPLIDCWANLSPAAPMSIRLPAPLDDGAFSNIPLPPHRMLPFRVEWVFHRAPVASEELQLNAERIHESGHELHLLFPGLCDPPMPIERLFDLAHDLGATKLLAGAAAQTPSVNSHPVSAPSPVTLDLEGDFLEYSCLYGIPYDLKPAPPPWIVTPATSRWPQFAKTSGLAC